MFDDLYREDVDRALRVEADAPRTEPKKEPGFFSGLGGASWRGLAQGAVETGRAGLNLLEAYGKSFAYTEGAPREESIDRMFEQSEVSKALGRTARSFDIDAETTGTAGQIVHGLTKFGGKAIGYGVTMGPFAPLGFGVDEGISEGLRLSDKGVDTETAIKAGVVHGGAAAASIALPVAGKTVAQTAGLTVVGGPGAFMAEQAAIREILDSAGHEDIAKEYDPFDVTGLVVSTLGPGAFGAAAHAARGIRARRAGKVASETKPVEGETAPPVGETRAPETVTEPVPREAVDAALVRVLNEAEEAAALAKRTDVGGMRAHVDAVRAAEDAINAGKIPDVTMIARVDPEIAAARGVDTAAPAARQAAGALETVVPVSDSLPGAAEPVAARSDAAATVTPEGAVERSGGTPPAEPGQPPAPAAREAVDRGAPGDKPAEPGLVDQLSERVKALEVQTDEGAKVAGLEVARQADAEARATERDANAFEAAVRCFINVGA